MAAGGADDEEQTYLDIMRDYECPDGCDFVDVLSEDDAMSLFIADTPLCPLCDAELERSEESIAALLAFVDESTTDTPASTLAGSPCAASPGAP